MTAVLLVTLLAFVALPLAVWGDVRRLRARPRSLLDEAVVAAKRRVLVVGGVALLHGPLLVTGHFFQERTYSTIESVCWFLCGGFALGAVAVAVVLMVRDIKLAAQFRRARAFVGRGADPPEPSAVDFGVGDARFEARVRGPGAYRDGEIVVWRAHGDPTTRWQVWLAPWLDLAVAVVAAALTVFDFSVRMV